MSNTYSAKLLDEVAKGYEAASQSRSIPAQWAGHYDDLAKQSRALLRDKGFTLGPDDEDASREEYEALSDYRKFLLKTHLTLSEHGLYCSCAAGARDNLTIPLLTESIAGDFVPKMELVLNRVKAEFFLARKSYYGFLHPGAEDSNPLEKDCFTELLNGEVLGLAVERGKVAFRLCFGILDKIALAICNLHGIEKRGPVYFHNFWRLDQDGRRAEFELIKSPGLLALYSIATDLNAHKGGEWSCFKEWRNALEHGLLVVAEDGASDPYNTLSTADGVTTIPAAQFRDFVRDMLQLTRSAIFSFVYAVRDLGLKSPRGLVSFCESMNEVGLS